MRRLVLFMITGLWLLRASTSAQELPPLTPAAENSTHPLDWDKLEAEAVQLLGKYIRINTSNPPGNELQAALFFKRLLEREGLEARVFEVAPERGNVYSILKGDGSRPALMLLNHLDVVQAERSFWSLDPFSSVIKEGYIYGRGSLDMKTTGMLQALTLINLKRSGVRPKRDVIFLGTADEEVGSLGTRWMIKNHPEVFRGVETLITEGATLIEKDGWVSRYEVDVAEKAALWLRLSVHGDPGHGSIPFTRDNAVLQLILALSRLAQHRTDIKVTPIVEGYFQALAAKESPTRAAQFRNLPRSTQDPRFVEELEANREYNAMLHNTISITVLKAGSQTNVIPNTAHAELDCRLLPGEEPEAFIASLRRVIANPQIQIERINDFVPSIASPLDSEAVRAIRTVAARYHPGVPITPSILTSTTESSLLRPLGIYCYGFEPYALDEEEVRRSHGNNERISLENVKRGLRIMYDLVELMVR